MFKLAGVLLFVVAVHGFYIDDGSSELEKEKIVGGEPDDVKNIPWIAQLLRSGNHICGATIISDRWLLTAAHCVQYRDNLSARIGSSYREQGQRLGITNIISHPKFDSKTFDNDIALIELTKPIRFSSVQRAIRLAREPAKENDIIVISGYGREGTDLSPSYVVKTAQVAVINWDQCSAKYPDEDEQISRNMFCAGTNDTDACQGDSGGPAVINGRLAGVISSGGEECASVQEPGTYTQVYKYRKWISSTTGLHRSSL